MEEDIKIELKEMDDIKERMIKEKEREKRFAFVKLAKELLEIVDNLERSMKIL